MQQHEFKVVISADTLTETEIYKVKQDLKESLRDSLIIIKAITNKNFKYQIR